MVLLLALALSDTSAQQAVVRATASGRILSPVSASERDWQREDGDSQKREITLKEDDGTIILVRLREFQ